MPGKRVVVVGGGNVAIDAARTCLRLGSEQVTIAYRRTRTEMPADVEEVEQAEEEGVRLSFLTVPMAIRGKDGRLAELACLRAKLVAEGGQRPHVAGARGRQRFTIEADTVVTAIGQRVDAECLQDLTDLSWTRRQTIRRTWPT